MGTGRRPISAVVYNSTDLIPAQLRKASLVIPAFARQDLTQVLPTFFTDPSLVSANQIAIGALLNRPASVIPNSLVTWQISPTDLPGIVAWYDASQLVGLSDGAAVASWTDSSGNGRDATQSTAAFQPLYKTNILNGLPAMLFDGSNDYLQTAAFTLNQPITCVVVMRTIGVQALTYVLDGGSVNTIVLQWRDNAGNPNVQLYAGSAACLTSLSTNATHIVVAQFNGASSLTKVDGGVSATGNPGTNNAGGLTLGAAGNGGTNWNGYMFEALVYSGALTASQLNAITGYLSQKYAIAATWT